MARGPRSYLFENSALATKCIEKNVKTKKSSCAEKGTAVWTRTLPQYSSFLDVLLIQRLLFEVALDLPSHLFTHDFS